MWTDTAPFAQAIPPRSATMAASSPMTIVSRGTIICQGSATPKPSGLPSGFQQDGSRGGKERCLAPRHAASGSVSTRTRQRTANTAITTSFAMHHWQIA